MHELTPAQSYVLLVMEKWQGRVALITGASSGIGYLLAKQLAEMGMAVVGCARNTTKIEVRQYLLPGLQRVSQEKRDWF